VAVVPYMFFFHSVINSHFIIQSLHLLCWPRYPLTLRAAVTVTTKVRPLSPTVGQFNLLHILTTCSIAIHHLSNFVQGILYGRYRPCFCSNGTVVRNPWWFLLF